MKRGFNGRASSRALATLCSIVLLAVLAAPAAAASYDCPDRTAAVLYLENENWKSDLVVTSPFLGATARISDCQGFAIFTQPVAAGGALLVPNFTANLCARTPVAGIAHLRVEGCASYATEATFRDSSTVFIPELGAPLEPRSSESIAFSPIETNEARSTFVALITEAGYTRVKLTVYDAAGLKAGTELVDVDGFAFYELQTKVTIGRLEASNAPPVVGPYTFAPVYAVAIVALRGGGSPRVVPGERRTPPAAP